MLFSAKIREDQKLSNEKEVKATLNLRILLDGFNLHRYKVKRGRTATWGIAGEFGR